MLLASIDFERERPVYPSFSEPVLSHTAFQLESTTVVEYGSMMIAGPWTSVPSPICSSLKTGTWCIPWS